MSNITPKPTGEIVLYQAEDGRAKLEVRFRNETVWLSLNQMADLFQRDKSVISRHIKNLFDEGELVRSAVVAESATTAADGKTYQVEFYNLDVIISVGYRVKSHRGTQFRIWATTGKTAAEAAAGGFLGQRYDFVFVDQSGFEKHAPKTFAALAASFTEYKA